MSASRKYVFNNSFPNHYRSSMSEDTNTDRSSTSIDQLLELTNSGNEIQRWSDPEIKILLSYLSENFDLYREKKKKFCAKAALKIGNKRTASQVKSKIQTLITKFEEENREETGKGSSCWEYFDDMNEIFGNRENVRPDYLSSSISIEV